MQQDEYSIVFKGKGLDELKELARIYNIPESNLGDVVVKAIKLLKVSANKKLTFKEDGREFLIDTKKM